MVAKTKWPCVFRGEAILEVNAKLYAQDPKVPFGAYQRAWRKQHCAAINPYGSESCPYTEQECADAFYKTASESLTLAKRSRVGLFRAFARHLGLVRSENRPLARYRIVRTDGHESRTASVRGGPTTRSPDLLGPPHQQAGDERSGVAIPQPVGVRRTEHRLTSIGAVLRGDGAGPRTHPYGWNERQASRDNDGNATDPLPLSPSRGLGDQPSSGDPDLHQGGK